MIPLDIMCPSCYRQKGKERKIYPKSVPYLLPQSGTQRYIYVYECEYCSYNVTQHEMLFHEFRVRFNQALNLLMHVRGWCVPSYNTAAGKLWVITRAVENYFEKNYDARKQ